jgi:hypothetical protein
MTLEPRPFTSTGGAGVAVFAGANSGSAGQASSLYLPDTVDSVAEFIGSKRYKIEAA